MVVHNFHASTNYKDTIVQIENLFCSHCFQMELIEETTMSCWKRSWTYQSITSNMNSCHSTYIRCGSWNCEYLQGDSFITGVSLAMFLSMWWFAYVETVLWMLQSYFIITRWIDIWRKSSGRELQHLIIIKLFDMISLSSNLKVFVTFPGEG